jgi:hypothetical protein
VNVRDLTTGYKGYTRRALERIDLAPSARTATPSRSKPPTDPARGAPSSGGADLVRRPARGAEQDVARDLRRGGGDGVALRLGLGARRPRRDGE